MEGLRDVERAIHHAVRAGAFRLAARSYPKSAATFEAAARINSAKCKAALQDAMGAVGAASARMRSR